MRHPLVILLGAVTLLGIAQALASCGPPLAPDGVEDCTEFDRVTMHAGRPVVCRMVWCEQHATLGRNSASGLAALWCDQ